MAELDPVLWRRDLPGRFNVDTETIRRWIASGKIPPPDVDLSRRTRGWRLSTLRKAGINLPLNTSSEGAAA
jgi:hypothetical protein